MDDRFLLLFVVLLAMLVAATVRCKFDFLEPRIIAVGMMTLSTFFALLTSEMWQFGMSVEGFLLIIGAMLAFCFGSRFAGRCFDDSDKLAPSDVARAYEVSPLKMTVTIALMLAMFWCNLQTIYELSVEYGNSGGYADMIRTLRPLIEQNELVFSRWISYRNQLAQAIAYVFFYMFAYNRIFAGVNRLQLLVPVACYIPFPILSTARMAVFFLAIYMIVVTLILYQKRNRFELPAKLNAVKYLIGGGIMFIAIFFVMGALTGKTISGERTPFIILAHYIGLSIPALDALIHQSIVETPYIGSHSLHGIYRALQKIDPSAPSVPLFDPLVHFVGIDTNVYTSLGHYFLDFGIVGTVIIMWILGAVYTFFYSAIKRRQSNFALMLMCYGAFCYPLFLISISERVFFDLLGTTSIYTLTLLFLSKKIFLR